MHGYVPSPCLHTTVIAGAEQRHVIAAAPEHHLPIIPAPKSRGRTKNFVDPCDIAPLKKRRIQVCTHARIVGVTLARRALQYGCVSEVAAGSINITHASILQVDLLSPGERDKVLHKREKNKLAAEKCRVKRREKVQQIRFEYDECLEANEALEAELAKLKEEKELLQNLLENHHCVLKLKV